MTPNLVQILTVDGGPAHKRNVAAAKARGHYLVFLDDDVEVRPDTLFHLWRAMEETPQCGMGFCKILKMDDRRTFDDAGSWITGTGFLWARAQNGLTDHEQFDLPGRVLASKSATCITRRADFMLAGGFDAAYFILGEETDLAWRLWLSGRECWYFPQAVSYHAFDTPLKPKDQFYTLSRIHEYGARNYVNMLLTNLSFWRLLWILPIHLALWVVAAGGFLLRGQWQRSWLIWKGIGTNFTHDWWRRTLKKRRQVQSSRKISDRALWPLISRRPPLTYYVQRITRYVNQGLHG